MAAVRRRTLTRGRSVGDIGGNLRCVFTRTKEDTVKRHKYSYGDSPSQWGELFLPDAAAPKGLVVVIHGGYWRSQYGAELGEPLAKDLAAHGMAAWNIEYRRAGNGGGWPETFDDVAAGIDWAIQPAGTSPSGQPGVTGLARSARRTRTASCSARTTARCR